ncbi:DUF554 domain-containing protein [Paratractidigestivibacter sp.]|uniref:DUF554 domain-containing protein n=1 Tax=Paratractidigestivibacter sp. TaxID=2847316 RepID=UPI002ABD27D8|nr:DUF554 domain-containing protein [Paratractidigestivibacter sp.]
MHGLGTIINVCCIVGGGLAGLVGRRFITQKLQDALLKACGLSVIFLGVGGTMEKMLAVVSADGGGSSLSAGGTMMILISLALGSAIGEAIDLDARFEQLGVWLREKTGSSGDASFVDGFVTASLTVCIGAMAIVGAIRDGLTGDYNTLMLKGAIDAVIICAMAASMGKGAMFAALPVGVWQGLVTVACVPLQPLMTTAALSNLGLVGSILIFCVGVNLIWPKTFKPANMLPAIFIAAALAYVM